MLYGKEMKEDPSTSPPGHQKQGKPENRVSKQAGLEKKSRGHKPRPKAVRLVEAN